MEYSSSLDKVNYIMMHIKNTLLFFLSMRDLICYRYDFGARFIILGNL